MTLINRNKLFSVGVIILTFVMVFLPAQIPIGWIQRMIVAVTGSLSLIFQLLLLLSADTKTKKTQSYVLLALSILVIIVMFISY
jgi:inner membrane protein involved in colicin E2 resistance